MNTINGINDQAAQIILVTIEDGSRATLTLYWRPQQNGWYFDLDWPGSANIQVPFASYNRRVVTAGNLLRQFRELLPFGLAVFTPDNEDPSTRTCWADGSATLVLLNSADVARVESEVYARA